MFCLEEGDRDVFKLYFLFVRANIRIDRFKRSFSKCLHDLSLFLLIVEVVMLVIVIVKV